MSDGEQISRMQGQWVNYNKISAIHKRNAISKRVHLLKEKGMKENSSTKLVLSMKLIQHKNLVVPQPFQQTR